MSNRDHERRWTHGKPPAGLTGYKAGSAEITGYKIGNWSTSNGELSERQPHLFYRAEEVDNVLDNLVQRQAFERRRMQALELFYLKELGYDEKMATLSGDGHAEEFLPKRDRQDED